MKLKDDKENLSEILQLSCWFAICAVITWLGAGVVVYVVSLVGGVARTISRPMQAIWIIFLLLGTSVISIPHDYEGHWGGEAPAPLWYWGIAIGLPAAAALAVLTFGRKSPNHGNCTRPLPSALKAFVAAILLATFYGYLQGNGIGIILRQGSGIFFLFLFMFLGYRLAPTATQLLDTFDKVRRVLIAYGLVYLVRYIYLNIKSVGELSEGTFLREPSPPLFFCGLFAALSIGESLFRAKRVDSPRFWIGTGVLGIAAIFSGSRADVACMFFTIVFFFLLRFVSHPFRLGVSLTAVALVFAWFKEALYSIVQSTALLQHLAGRFLVSPESDSSFLQRSSQMVAIWEVFRSRPLLGQGIGASLVWFDPAGFEWVETAFVDNGFGYLLFKTGCLGALAFLWFLAVLFKKTWRIWNFTEDPVFLCILGTLVFYTAFLPFEAVFFQFLFCFWVALVMGYLLRADATQGSPVRVASPPPKLAD